MKVAIVGSQCGIGRRIENSFMELGIEFIKYSSKFESVGDIDKRKFVIEDPSLGIPSGLTHLVYLSWASSREEEIQRKNSHAAAYVSRWCINHEIKAVFISSMAASCEEPTSNYGRWKKFTESEFEFSGFAVFRPGTIVTKDGIDGSAINRLMHISFLGRLALRSIRPIRVPIVTEEKVVELIIQWLNGRKFDTPREIQTQTKSVQELLNINYGFISLRMFSKILRYLPIDIRDRIKVLLDLERSIFSKE